MERGDLPGFGRLHRNRVGQAVGDGAAVVDEAVALGALPVHEHRAVRTFVVRAYVARHGAVFAHGAEQLLVVAAVHALAQAVDVGVSVGVVLGQDEVKAAAGVLLRKQLAQIDGVLARVTRRNGDFHVLGFCRVGIGGEQGQNVLRAGQAHLRCCFRAGTRRVAPQRERELRAANADVAVVVHLVAVVGGGARVHERQRAAGVHGGHVAAVAGRAGVVVDGLVVVLALRGAIALLARVGDAVDDGVALVVVHGEKPAQREGVGILIVVGRVFPAALEGVHVTLVELAEEVGERDGLLPFGVLAGHDGAAVHRGGEGEFVEVFLHEVLDAFVAHLAREGEGLAFQQLEVLHGGGSFGIGEGHAVRSV